MMTKINDADSLFYIYKLKGRIINRNKFEQLFAKLFLDYFLLT